MAYTKTTWATTEPITATRLNNLETQYDAASADLTTHKNDKANPHAVTAAQVGAVPTTDKGAANGVASLDAGGQVPAGQLSNVPVPASSNYFVTGTYTGNGAASMAVNLGFAPKAVIIQASTFVMDHSNGGSQNFYGGHATSSKDLIRFGSSNVIVVTTTGFNVYYDSANDVYTNENTWVYNYIALK